MSNPNVKVATNAGKTVKKSPEQLKKDREDKLKERKSKLDKMSDTERSAYLAQEKTDNFKKIGKRRLTNIVNQIRNLGKLASSNYKYTAEQVDKIEETINTEVENMLTKFRAVKSVKESVNIEL